MLANRVVGVPQPPRGRQWLRVAAIRLPRISNSTDVEALACEPGVVVRWVTDAADLADADVVVIPGSKATVADLAWLRERGLDTADRRARRGGPDGARASAAASRCCAAASTTPWSPVSGTSSTGWVCSTPTSCSRPTRRCAHHSSPLSGYEIHHGQRRPQRRATTGSVSASARGAVFGTHWHGLLDNNDVRRDWLTRRGRGPATGSSSPPTSTCPRRRDAQLDLMADLLAAHTDIAAILGLLDTGPPPRPTVTTALSG